MKILFTLFFTFLLILFFDYSYSQTATSTVAHNEKNIYFQALTQYVYFEKWNRGVTIDTLFIEDDSRLTDSLVLLSGQTKFITLKSEDVSDYSKTQKGIVLYKVLPLQFENGEFSVSLVPVLTQSQKKIASFLPQKKKQNTVDANTVSYKVVYKYDGSKFIFQRLDHFGI